MNYLIDFIKWDKVGRSAFFWLETSQIEGFCRGGDWGDPYFSRLPRLGPMYWKHQRGVVIVTSLSMVPTWRLWCWVVCNNGLVGGDRNMNRFDRLNAHEHQKFYQPWHYSSLANNDPLRTTSFVSFLFHGCNGARYLKLESTLADPASEACLDSVRTHHLDRTRFEAKSDFKKKKKDVGSPFSRSGCFGDTHPLEDRPPLWRAPK